MGTQEAVYLSAMIDSLHKKINVLKEIGEATKTQGAILKAEKPDMDAFDEMMDQKEELIAQVNQLDTGFDQLFQKVQTEVTINKMVYRNQIEQLQELIRTVTDLGMKIQKLEAQNRDAFEAFLTKERREIRTSRAQNKTAQSYYQNMPNQHRQWQTYFLDQKK